MSAMTTCLELVLPAAPSSVRRARTAVGAAVAEVSHSERLADDVRLCVSEAVTNVVRHAYGTRRGDLELVVEVRGDEVDVVVHDSGKGMTASNRRGSGGGYGLKIIEKLASRFELTSKLGTGTEVRMVFRLADEKRTRRGPPAVAA
jgi:anti-sigma regulatory factor (Ser/Thr protein kinase)